MNRKRLHKIERKLDAFYKTIPVSIECKGLCQESCGPIGMTAVEFGRISEASGIVPSIDEHGTCSLLVDGKCSVYEVRPTICRLWGASLEMVCPFGCKPTPRYLTQGEGFRIIKKVDEICENSGSKATLKELEDLMNAIS